MPTRQIPITTVADKKFVAWPEKRTSLHDTLSEVYNWFTEGFDTKDLQEAKALLESFFAE